MLKMALEHMMLLGLGGASLVACGTSGVDNAQGTGDADRLTVAERAIYVADAQYLQKLAAPGVAVHLNFADPAQFRFAQARLKLAGKTAINSPHLFELMESNHQAHVRRGLRAGTFAPSPHAATTGVEDMHYLEVTSPRMTPTMTGTAASSFPGGTDYTYVDLTISSIGGTAIAPLNYQEEFESATGVPGANVKVSTAGSPTASSQTRYTYESFKFADTPDGGSESSYVHAEVGSAAVQTPAPPPMLSTPTVDAPVDSVGVGGAGPDGTINVCMDRSWTNDCDYIINTGSVTDHRIKMPLKGAVTLITAHVFDRATITAMQTALDMNQTPAYDPGQVKLILTNVGGGCDVDASNALNAGMSGFWDYATISPDNKTLSWDVTGAHAIYFDQGCSQIQDEAKLTMRIAVPVLSVPGNVAFQTAFTITSDAAVLRPDKFLPKVTLTNSCLAEGTEIAVGDGAAAPIESLHIGQAVYSPYATGNHALTIEDTAQGHEAAPMVRIRDAAGHHLLMTEMHPIATPDRGMVQARVLRVGDVVLTTSGPSALTEVSREPYSGKVYNLKVGSPAEVAALAPDQTAVSANGFVVGDGQIQSKYEQRALLQGSRTSLSRVPEAWRRDYLLSIVRN